MRIAAATVLGAVVAGGIAAAVVWVSSESARFALDAARIFAVGGAIGGAVGGALAWWKGRSRLALVAGALGAMLMCCLIALAVPIYTQIPWPSPQAFTGAEVTASMGGGSWGMTRIQKYTVQRSIDELRAHYERQMRLYCVGDWRFTPLPDCKGYTACLEAECRIRRPGMEQFFEVTLRATSDDQTECWQKSSWED